jgi:hypothetical protein
MFVRPRQASYDTHRGGEEHRGSSGQMEDKMDRLKGKVIIISGGARGQGAAEARLFAAEGGRVVIGDVLALSIRRGVSSTG